MPDDKQKSLFSVPGEKPISQFEITNPVQPSFRDFEIQRQRYLDSIYYNMPSVISSGFELMPEERRKVLFQTSTAPQDNLIPTEENKKKVHYTPEEIKAKEVQQRGTESPIAQSLMSILPGGIAQNLEFMLGTNTLSGGELLTDSNRYRLSKEEVQKLRETNLLTDEEVENYLKNQEEWGSLELVRGIGQGLINSLLIGVETAVTGGGNLQFKLGEFGSKMFTKEALKFATKQSLQQGIATLKAASIGTIIRAGDGIKQDLAEIEKQGKPVETLDVIGSILKNTAVETALTASEGITEGLVRDMKLAPLGKGWTETLSGWKQFAKNVGKKTFSSLFVETGTEQLTDIITDVTKGEQSAFWNIWTGDTPEVRKQALNNLITEAAIGLLLGNIYGIKDVTKGSTERYIAEAVNRKEITEEDGQRLLAMMDDIDVNKIKETAVNLNNYLKAKELIDNTPELKAVASVIESINDKTLPNTDDQINILTSAEVALKAKEKSNKKQGNTLDLAIEAGIQYVDSQITAGLEASKGEITPEIQALKTVRDNLSTMDFNLMHSYTESIRKNVVKVLSKSTDPNIKNALQTLADNKISLDDVSDYIALKSLGTADIFASKALEKFKNLEFKDVVPTLDYLKDQLPKDALLFMPNAIFADHMQKLKGLSQVLQVLSDNLKNPSKPQNKELFSAVPLKPGLDRVEADTGFDPHFNSFARYLRSESKRWVHNNPEEWTGIVNEHINSDIKDELSQFGISIVDITNADTDYLDNLARHIQEAKSVNPEISDESTAKIIDALSRIKQDVYLQVHDIAQELNEAMPTLVPKGDVTPELVTEIYKQIRNRFLDNLSKDANRNNFSTEEIQKQIDEKEALLSGILEGLEAYVGKPIQVMLDEIELPSNIITELNIPLKPVIYDVMLNSTGLIDPNMLQEMKTYGDLLADVPEITTIGDLIDHFIEKKLMPEELIPFAKILKAAVGDIYVHITDLGANEKSIAQAATAIVESLLTEEEVDTTIETPVYKWARYSDNSYEVSSAGDKRFSALYAKLKDGRTIEEAYQLDIKGYRSQGNDWRLGKGKPPIVPYYTGLIKPEPNTIFVFGSNPEGKHGAGAAKVAKEQFGAIYGQGEGLQGNAYALPTKDLRVKENNGLRSIPKEQIIESIKRLYEVAKQNPDKKFKIAYTNTSQATLSGYTGFEMIDMFNSAGERPANIIFSKEWADTGKLKPISKEQQWNEYKNLWRQYLDENPELLQELREKAKGKVLTDKFASSDVSQARALAEILNETPVSSTTEFVNYSGGAVGSDTAWEEIGAKYGVKTKAFSFKGHDTKSPNKIELTEKELNEGWQAVLKANETLKRNISNLSPYIKNLLSRNWFQVKNAEVVYAIGKFDKSGYHVDGGTGWAVQMAIDNKKPVIFFDQENVKDKTTADWYAWDYQEGGFMPLDEAHGYDKYRIDDTPILVQNFAGIGTRELTPEGRQAIETVYQKTFGTQTQKSSVQEPAKPAPKPTAKATGAVYKEGNIYKFKEPVVIFTDGSDRGKGKNGRKFLGYGIATKVGNKIYEMSSGELDFFSEQGQKTFKAIQEHLGITPSPEDEISNPVMELWGAYRALSKFQNSNAHITIYADYLGVTHWFDGTWKAKNPYIKAILAKIKEIEKQIVANGGSITIKHVKGHSGVSLNERVDYLAKSPSRIDTINLEQMVKDSITLKSEGKRVIYGKFLSKDGRRIIQLNKQAPITEGYDPVISLLHEAIHAYTADWLESEDAVAREFRSKLMGLKSQVARGLSTSGKEQGYWLGTLEELREAKQKYADEIASVLENESTGIHELLALLSNPGFVKDVLRKISALADRPAKVNNIWETIKGFFKQLYIRVFNLDIKTDSPTTVAEALLDLISDYSTDLEAYHISRKAAFKISADEAKLIKQLNKLALANDTPEEIVAANAELGDKPLDQLEYDTNEATADTDEDMLKDLSNIKSTEDILLSLGKFADKKEFSAHIHLMGTFENFLTWINELNGKQALDSHLQHLYKTQYKQKYFRDPEGFRESYLKRLYLKHKEQVFRPHIIIKNDTKINPDTNETEKIVNLEVQPGKFIYGDGSIGDGYVAVKRLDELVSKLGTLFPKKAFLPFKLMYLAGIEDYNLGTFIKRTSINKYITLEESLATAGEVKKLTNIMFNGDKKDYRYIFLGNYGGRSTNPVIAIPKTITDNPHFRESVNKFLEHLWNSFVQTLPDTLSQQEIDDYKKDLFPSTYAEGLQYIFRMLTHEAWFNPELLKAIIPTDEELSQSEQEINFIDKWLEYIKSRQEKGQSIFAMGDDFNKVMKRGMALLTDQTHNLATDPHTLNRRKALPTGFTIQNGQVHFRIGVIDSRAKGNIEVKLADNSVEIVDISKLLLNTIDEGLETTDGAIFVLANEFEDYYYDIFGVLKDGTIKAVYSSKIGEEPVYLKFAIHVVPKNSPLGQVMLKGNLAMLASDTAVKVGLKNVQKINIADVSKVDVSATQISPDMVATLPLNNLQRIKEELGTNTKGGTIKQITNASGLTKNSQLLKQLNIEQDITKALDYLASRAIDNALKEYEASTTQTSLMNYLVDIIHNPVNQQELLVSKMLQFLPALSEDDRLQYIHLTQHPTIAAAIRNRLMRILNAGVQNRIAGMRMTLGPDIGLLAPDSNVNPIINKWNIRNWITNLDINDATFVKLVPQKWLREGIKKYQNLQRKEARMHTDRSYGDLMEDGRKQSDYIKEEKLQVLEELKAKAAISKDLMDWQIEAINNENIYDVINMQHPAFKDFADKIKSQVFQEGYRLKGRYTIISEDFAKKYGLRPGDRVFAVITPTDSGLGGIPLIVAGIAPVFADSKNPERKSIDRMKIVVNSELIQSLLGKDYDIDTISVMPFHPEYWTEDLFNKFLNAMEKLHDNMPQALSKVIDATIGKPNRPVSSIFDNAQRVRFMQSRLGAKMLLGDNADPLVNMQYQSPIISMYNLLIEYAKNDIGQIVYARLVKDAMNAIGFKIKRFGEVFTMNHDNAIADEAMLNIATNHFVDWPGKTDKLYYNNNTDNIREALWGKNDVDIERMAMNAGVNPDVISKSIAVLNSLTSNLVLPAFRLASGLDLQGNNLTLVTFIETVKHQQTILRLLQSTSYNDRAKLTKILVGPRFDSMNSNTQKRYTELVHSMQVDNVLNYPLFKTIMSIPVDSLQIPGSMYEDWLIDQVEVGRTLLAQSPVLYKIMYERILPGALPDSKHSTAVFFKKTDKLEKHFAWRFYNIVSRRRFVTSQVDTYLNLAMSTWSKEHRNAFTKIPREDVKARIEFLENTIASPTVGGRFAKLDAKRKTTLLDTVIYAVHGANPDHASFALQEMMTAYYEYVAARSWTNVPYSSEFLRNNKPVSVNIRAIGLSMLPSSLDFYSNRIDKLQSLAMIQSATAIAYFGQQESANTTSGKTSQRLDKARAVAYPVLLAKLAERGAPDSKPMTLTVSTPQGLERITLQIKDGKFFVTTADQKSTIQISPLKRTAKFSDAAIDPKMREHSPVTYYSTLLFTPNHFWFNKNNRLVISNNIDFLHNLLPSERLQVMEDILRDNLYNPDIPYSRVDREAFWLASLAQGTDYGEFNNTIVNFINNKTLFDPNKPMDYKSNELAWYLLAKFEPSLGKLLFKTYSQIASTERLPNDLPISNNINSFHNSINDNGIVLYSTRRTPGINSLSYATNFVSDELQGILLRGLQDEGYRTLVKLYKEKGYEAAAKFVAEKATRSIIYTELSKLGFNPKQLAKDILRLSQNELNEKYGNGVQSILEYLEKELSHDDNPKVVAGKLFVEQKVATKSKTIGGLVEAYFALKAAEQAASRTAEAASTMWKKLGRDIKHSQLPYDVWGVLKEHKIYGYGNPVDHNEPIDIAFDINPKYGLSIKEITIEDVKMFNNYYATSPIKLVGLSSIALYKQQYLVRSINRIQSDLADSVKLVTEFVNLVYDKNAKTDLGAKITSGAIQDPSIKLLKSLLDQADLRVITKTFPDEAAYTEYIFNLAENLTAQTDIKVKRTSEGKLAYIYKDKTYNSITALMDNYPAHPGKKLSIMIALQFRDLYDVKVPTLLIRALGYLAKIKEELVDLDDLYNISIIDALIDKYESYLSAINRKQGSYMPHMYSREQLSVDYIGERGSSIYQDLLKDIKNAKAGLIKDKGLAEIDLSDLDVITSGYDDNPEALRQLKASNPSAYAKISKAITTKAKVQKILNRRIVRSLRSSEANSDLTYVIGNLLPRTSKNPDYIKSTSEPHYRYISTLVFGVKNDLLLADYIMYDSKARATGENPEMRELTKRWYAEQANNKFFHTKGISTSDLKRGDEIVFFTHGMQYDPQTDTEVFRKFAHAGIVESVDHEKKTFTLKVDKAEAKAQIQRRIGKLATLLNKMIQSDNPTPISMDTIRELKQLVADGYLKAGLLSKNTTEAQGLRLLLTGYNNKLKYLPQSNVFSFADVSFRDAMGPDQDEYVGLYHLDGALEYFTNLKNRYKNLRNKYGTYENKLDAALYHLFSGLETLTYTSNVVKNMIVLSFMGTVNAAKALTTNTVGAILSNILDAPVSYTRYAKAGRQLWRSFKGKKTYEMTEDQRNFYNIFVSLGLINTRDLKSISLEAANLDAIAMLSENGFLQSIRTLALALYHGGEYRKHIDRIAKYRQLSIMSTGLESIQYSRKVLQEQAKWKAYLNNLISKKEYKSDDPAMTSKAEKALAQRSTKTIRTSNKSNSMTDLEVPGLAAKFIWKSFFTGPLGIGLQSIGEFLRRPAFFSGYYQALDLGYTHDQAVQFGINNIEMRHAFYGKANRVMGANRRLGKLSKLYVQYTMNNMLKTFINFKRAIIQFISQKNTEVIDNNKNRAKAIVVSVFRKSIDLVDAQGQAVKNAQNITLGEVNIARRLMLQTTLAMMIAQMGNTVFYGLQNMVPPVYQFLYDSIRLALETMGFGPDDDEDEDSETTKNELLWVLQETLFWLGVPFKIAIQEASKNPDDQGTINGRLKDAMEVLDRTYNTFSYAFGDSEIKIELEENKAKQLKDVSFVIDKMLFGIKLTGWQPANDLYGEYTGERWVWQDPFSEDAKFPYIAGREEGLIRKRMRTRTVLENLDASGIQQSIGGPGQELERLILLTRINNFLRASIPYFDLVNPVDVAE